MDRIFAEISLMLTNWKIALGSFGTLGAFLADAAAEVSGYENVGTKGLLVLGILYLFRQLQIERADTKEREAKLSAIVEANTKAMESLKVETQKQTSYHEGIAKALIDQAMHKKPDA